jgi:hypothetical protein
MTINKSQRQIFQEIVICLQAPVFAHGQLYVTLFRVGDPCMITMLITQPRLPGQPPDLPVTLNVVYTEIFQYVNAPLPDNNNNNNNSNNNSSNIFGDSKVIKFL